MSRRQEPAALFFRDLADMIDRGQLHAYPTQMRHDWPDSVVSGGAFYRVAGRHRVEANFMLDGPDEMPAMLDALARGTYGSLSSKKLIPDSVPEKRAPWWFEVLGLEPCPPAELDEARIRAAYRARAKTAHPDAGGSNEQMVRLNEARDAALKEIGGAR